MAGFDFSLKSLIRAVSQELLDSQRVRIEEGHPALFEVEEFTIDVSFVVTENAHAGGGFDLKIVKADTSIQYDSSSVHKISLKMKALKGNEGEMTDSSILMLLPDELPLRPRSEG